MSENGCQRVTKQVLLLIFAISLGKDAYLKSRSPSTTCPHHVQIDDLNYMYLDLNLANLRRGAVVKFCSTLAVDPTEFIATTW